MFLTALLLTATAVVACAVMSWRALRLLRLDPMETLLWLGLAEVPPSRAELSAVADRRLRL